jgi:L-threonylcarbamoyladenylate synthase
MNTQLLNSTEIKVAATIIKRGGVVAFPTETVYGLGADATNEVAIQKVFDVKGRPAQNPLIVHFESLEDLFKRIPDLEGTTKKVLCQIKEALTVVIPRPEWIPGIVSAGLNTVAVRVPACEFAREFIKACGVPLVAPSANVSGRPSPTQWEHVHADLDGKVDAIFKSNPTRIGVESTVVKVLPDKIQVLRLGGICTLQLEKILPIEIVCGSVESPGARFKHYAPTCKMVVAKFGPDMTARIKKFIKGKNATVIFWRGNADDYFPSSPVHLGKTLAEITRNLYSAIRRAEKGRDVIVCEGFPETAEYETLRERVARAAEGVII